MPTCILFWTPAHFQYTTGTVDEILNQDRRFDCSQATHKSPNFDLKQKAYWKNNFFDCLSKAKYFRAIPKILTLFVETYPILSHKMYFCKL